MKKYNIALIPINIEQFLKYAKNLTHRTKAETYCIGGKSIPHVTLCHLASLALFNMGYFLKFIRPYF